MQDEYILKTIRAYNNSPQKYIQATKDMLPIVDLNKFLQSLAPNSLILDAGCGYGRDTNYILHRGFNAAGIDLSEKLLEEANKLYPGILFQKMDIRQLHYPENHFDGIWCHAALHHLNLPDIKKSLLEFRRVLKTGGVLFVSFKEGNNTTQEVDDSLTCSDPRFYTFLTSDMLRNILIEVGFNVKEVEKVNERLRFGNGKRNINWIHVLASK